MIGVEPNEKKTRKTINIEVVKVEKNKKVVWVATLKHNGNFPKKWFTVEVSVWSDDKNLHLPVKPKSMSREKSDLNIDVEYSKADGMWSYSEEFGDAMFITKFSDTKGVAGFTKYYMGPCESFEVNIRLK
jgi:hypothetical protein